jgi:hypothetical protein
MVMRRAEVAILAGMLMMRRRVRGHEKVPTVGHVEGSAGGHLKVPALHG